jgi:hypothetical protein
MNVEPHFTVNYGDAMVTALTTVLLPALSFIVRSLWKIDRRLIRLEMKQGMHRREEDTRDEL